MDAIIYFLFLVLLYGGGFLLPMRHIHSRGGWWISLLTHLLAVPAMIMIAAVGGFIALMVFGLPITFYAAGAISGHLTRLVLLLANWRALSLGGVLVVGIGFAIPPTALEAHRVLKRWQAEEAYAQLPDASTLPDIAACSGFRNTGKLLDRTLVSPPFGEPVGIPAGELSLRYPIDYEWPSPPRHPKPGVKVKQARFQMHSDDATPITRQDEHDPQGRHLPVMERRHAIIFNLFIGSPTSRTANGLLNLMDNNFSSMYAVPNLKLAPSTVPGVQMVVRPKQKYGLHDASYVAMKNGEIAELIQCGSKDRVPNPDCSFRFDAGTLAVEGSFRPADIRQWPKTRAQVQAFAECSVAAAQAD
jgi:hypothetical protein